MELARRVGLNVAGTIREVFSRVVFNILVSNTDDRARNHAAFCDEQDGLELTPA